MNNPVRSPNKVATSVSVRDKPHSSRRAWQGRERSTSNGAGDYLPFVAGVDEVGRGPLAGPIAVCAVVYDTILHEEIVAAIPGVRDSKQLPMHKREVIARLAKNLAKEGRISYAVAFVSSGVIDARGLTHAARLATKRALKRAGARPNTTLVLLDGGLHAPKIFRAQKTIIRGDQTQFIISLASVIAKVARDKRMVRLSEEFPKYGFDGHKGYGTDSHVRAIKKHGVLQIHRKTFIKNIISKNHRPSSHSGILKNTRM